MAIDSGATAFIIISMALVNLMTPGLAFFYGGLVRQQNVLTIIMQNFVSMGLVTIIWVIWGFSLCFGEGGVVIGNPVTLARSGAGEAVGRVAEAVSTEVSGVAEQGRGEARIMLWRVWKWGERKVEAVRDFVSRDDSESEAQSDSSAGEQGETQ